MREILAIERDRDSHIESYRQEKGQSTCMYVHTVCTENIHSIL